MNGLSFRLLLLAWTSLGFAAAGFAADALTEVATDSLTPAEAALHKLLNGNAKTVRLWPSKAPDETKPIAAEAVGPIEKKENTLAANNVSEPSIVVARPNQGRPANGAGLGANGPTAAMLICPGGGYGGLGIETNGSEIAKWLNDNGIAGVVLKYRVPKRHQGFPMHHHALQDAQRAMGIVRQKSAEWNIDPKRIGAIGFSAGGHLVASLTNNYKERSYPRVDAADDVSCRPDFAVLIYPAYLTDPIDSDQLDKVQKVEQISRATTPPTFIAVAQADKFARGAAIYYLALRQARVPGELHIYDGGGHGNGLRAAPLSEFAPTCIRWLAAFDKTKEKE